MGSKIHSAEMASLKLEKLGRRVIAARLYERRRAARNRQLLQVVHDHLHASASELQDRLLEVYNSDQGEPTDAEMEVEISKLR